MAKEKSRLLLVDDEESIIKIVGRKLETAGFEVLTAETGKAALEQAAEQLPDLIILDVMLPHMSGFEVCAKLREEPRTKKIPISRVTLGKACRISVNERNDLRPGKFKLERAWPANADTNTTVMVINAAIKKVLNVTRQMLG